jgi:dihydroorotase
MGLQMLDYMISGATDSSGKKFDFGISAGRIVEPGAAAISIDADGLMAISGFVDLHTHLREPGFERSETVESGSRAAALGGYTAVHAMPNTFPVADSAGVVEQVFAKGQAAGYVHVQPIGAVTIGLEGKQLSDMGAMAHSRANVSIFSDDGKCVFDALLMRRALEYAKSFDAVIAQHAQEPSLTENAQMNEGLVSAELGLAGWPSVAEEAIIARDVLLAEQTGGRLHICHISTAGSVEVIRWAKARGIAVTAEVTPHHLVLSENLVRGYNPVYKVNPPLRTDEDVLALREALIDGTIDVVATDHAPHPLEAKDCEWSAAAFGMLGLEAAASIVQEVLIDSGASNWKRFEDVMSTKPALIAKLKNQGQPVQIGKVANLALIDAAARRDGSLQHSKSQNNPYSNFTLSGRIEHTFFGGVQTVSNANLVTLEAKVV